MEVHLISPIYVFLISILLGIILSIFFDFFKIMNFTFEFNNLLIFTQDILYFGISGVITFIFLLAFNNGKMSFFIVLGEIIGWTLWHLIAGNRITCFLSKKIYLLKKVFSRVKTRILNQKAKSKKVLIKAKSFIFKKIKIRKKQKEN